ncbi:transporter, partial [Xanthomonas dyei]
MVPPMSMPSKCVKSCASESVSSAAPDALRLHAGRLVASAGVVFALCCGVSPHASAQSQDAPAFDRPGIPFAAEVLQPGAFAWEQGLPDASTDRADGQRTTLYTADTVLRFGVSDSMWSCSW